MNCARSTLGTKVWQNVVTMYRKVCHPIQQRSAVLRRCLDPLLLGMERKCQRFAHVLNRMERHIVAHVFRNVHQVFRILSWQDDRADTGAMRGKHLFF